MIVLCVFGGDRDTDRHSITKPDGLQELQILVQIDRSRPGQFRAQHRRDQRAAPHPVRNHFVEHVRMGVFLIHMGGVHIAGHDRKQFYI